MLPSSINDVIFTRVADKKYLQRIVGGEVRFPNPAKRGFLFYGTYGSGKTTLAHLLPVLIEHCNAADAERTSYNWQYEYAGETVSVTPNNGGKPSVRIAKQIFTDCGKPNSNSSTTVVEHLSNAAMYSLDMLAVGGKFNHFILDELDCWLSTSQAKLKAMITSCPSWNVFYITTNNVHKIDGGIRSRCIEIELNGGAVSEYLKVIRRDHERLADYSDAALSRVVQAACGDWRNLEDAMNRL